ncbi:alpha/beta fold hydrolase [Nocardia macrotermitis]|uniref:2-hydroxymuconate semialdehyde hydrolase n=1 Tax=Nocardia macrotermitis TaxID=2585198 RepID=A0A7K0CUQ9_9NOCA|nr:alpha/beta fold hydrolase [Nocardia macrotermitis]MQY17181.1 2-hydroxymuconate semialdehyde hydrolase [Nocardia macrotermitis]
MAAYDIQVPGIGSVPVTVTETGSGPVHLLLHGGAGPQSVQEFAERYAREQSVRVLTPVHPGFGGTPRPEAVATMGDLAEVYIALLDQLGLDEVTVIGNSIGGWITAEIASRGSDRLAAAVLVCAVGLEVPGVTPVDFFGLRLDEIADYSYHRPDAFRIDPSTFTPQQVEAMAGNRISLQVYGGERMTDPTLTERLAAVTVPVLVISGVSDRIALPEVGRAFAAAIPGARYELLPETGHLPQLETPEQLVKVLAAFGTGK